MPPRRRKGQATIEKLNQRLERLTIEYVSAAALTPNDYNPNRQTEHQFTLLKSSILEDGFTDPIKVVDRDGQVVIVDGEHRWRAVRELHEEGKLADDVLAIVRLPQNEAQAKIATLRHNRARGQEDIGLATDVLRDLERLDALDWAADSLDMSDAELQRLLADIPAPDDLAAEQFTEAWVPGGNEERADGPVQVSSTASGVMADRQREQAIKAAATEEERQQARVERNVYRLHLTFGGDEADVVKAALGPKPAETILAWCRERAADSLASVLDGDLPDGAVAAAEREAVG
jgi:ParB-like chromosome segregation protein Spo0J